MADQLTEKLQHISDELENERHSNLELEASTQVMKATYDDDLQRLQSSQQAHLEQIQQ